MKSRKSKRNHSLRVELDWAGLELELATTESRTDHSDKDSLTGNLMSSDVISFERYLRKNLLSVAVYLSKGELSTRQCRGDMREGHLERRMRVSSQVVYTEPGTKSWRGKGSEMPPDSYGIDIESHHFTTYLSPLIDFPGTRGQNSYLLIVVSTTIPTKGP